MVVLFNIQRPMSPFFLDLEWPRAFVELTSPRAVKSRSIVHAVQPRDASPSNNVSRTNLLWRSMEGLFIQGRKVVKRFSMNFSSQVHHQPTPNLNTFFCTDSYCT